MLEIISKIIANVLTALYQPFWFSLVLAILLMNAYLTASESSVKVLIQNWKNHFIRESSFRKLFFFLFYLVMTLFRTLLNRNMTANPISNVIGVWGIYNAKGNLTTESIENMMLFIPFMILFWMNFKERFPWKTLGGCLVQSAQICFLFSMTIEFLQLFLRLGTFQLSDLFYNTLGGIIGGLCYWGGLEFRKKRQEKKEQDTESRNNDEDLK